MSFNDITIDLLYIGVYVLGEPVTGIGGIMIAFAFIDFLVATIQVLRK